MGWGWNREPDRDALGVKPGSVRPYRVILVMIERIVDASRFHSQGHIQPSLEIPRRDTLLISHCGRAHKRVQYPQQHTLRRSKVRRPNCCGTRQGRTCSTICIARRAASSAG